MGKSGFAAFLLLSMLNIAACSGGGGSGSAAPTPINSAPTITSSPTVSVPENATGVIYTATATDPDSNAISFSIGGTDAGLFSIDSGSGGISFNASPNFESPSDADTNNVYQITLTASDGDGGSDSLNISISVTNEADTRYIDEVFTGVDVSRDITFAPGLTMDVYTPSGDTATNRPVMIAASGGGFLQQDALSVEPIARAFARRGYIGVTINYTVLSNIPNSPDELAIGGLRATHDMFAAVRFVRASAQGANSFGAREDAIFVAGESAGAVMSMIASTLDPIDTLSNQATRDFLNANGGVYGNVGSNNGVSSTVQGAVTLSGAILDLATIDASSAPMFAAHEEFDPVVPCDTAAEGSSDTGLVVSGSCDIIAAYQSNGIAGELYLVAGDDGHVGFTDTEREEIYQGAATLFFNTVINN